MQYMHAYPIMQFVMVMCMLLVHTPFCLAGEICCRDVGCFDNNPPYDELPLPQCAESMEIHMTVYTRTNPTAGQTITRTTIPEAYNGNRTTMFIVNGWREGLSAGWMTSVKDAILNQVDYNVVIVGWLDGFGQFWYPQSASDTRTVGTEIGLVAKNVISKAGATQSSLYCVGHSLGAHVCGHAGHVIKFGRITGLDPAGPLFEYKDWKIGLNPSCADVVEVVHTNGKPGLAFHLGTTRTLGHIDFYPNGGGSQPDCLFDVLDITTVKLETIFSVPVLFFMAKIFPLDCSHMRVLDYYLASVTDQCFMSNQTCYDELNIPESCTIESHPVQTMGFGSFNYPTRGIIYLETNGQPPYCTDG